MHDLATIHKLNAQAYEKAIKSFRAQGRHVLLKYEGLHLVSIETFSSADDIVDAHQAALRGAQVGERFVCLAPFHPDSPEVAQVRGRDQSEDRTLGDYINRKSY